MIKCIIYLFLISSLAKGFNYEQCRHELHEDWFCNYMKKHNRTYLSSEVKLRKHKLMSSKITSEVDGVRFGLTSRSDYFKHEFKLNSHFRNAKHLVVSRPKENKHIHLAAPKHLPPIDWRNVNGRSYVSPVKDQGDCGGCFAFASASVLEFWSREEGEPKSLSSQSLMDCTSFRGLPDDGCEGGLMEYVFEYAKNHPVPLEVEWPFLEHDDVCPKMKYPTHVRVGDFRVLMHDDNRNAEQELEYLLHAYGPISIGIDSRNMEHYVGGIFRSRMCGKDIDHAVTIVGYTKDAWIIKNSWGPYWGVGGYLYLERGKNACGVAEYIVYVTRATPVSYALNTNWIFNNGWIYRL